MIFPRSTRLLKTMTTRSLSFLLSPGFQDYSFKFDVEINMDNTAWRGYFWERHDPVTLSKTEEYGVY